MQQKEIFIDKFNMRFHAPDSTFLECRNSVVSIFLCIFYFFLLFFSSPLLIKSTFRFSMPNQNISSLHSESDEHEHKGKNNIGKNITNLTLYPPYSH